jgi:hypothetical protein
VLPLAESHERAAVLSTIYVLSYLALGLPAVVAGFLVVHGGVLSTAREYGLAVMVLAALALLGLVAQRPRQRRASAVTMHKVGSPEAANSAGQCNTWWV